MMLHDPRHTHLSHGGAPPPECPHPGHRPGHHPPHHHGPHHLHSGGRIAFWMDELQRQYRGNYAVLHDLEDEFLPDVSVQTGICLAELRDPGRLGEEGAPIDPVRRAMAVDDALAAAGSAWLDSLARESVLVLGEFPPHILDVLLAVDLSLTQVHEPGPHGTLPPHFQRLAPLGLVGISDALAVVVSDYSLILFHAFADGDVLWTSDLVPALLARSANVPVQVLISDHRAPHCRVRIPDASYARIPILE